MGQTGARERGDGDQRRTLWLTGTNDLGPIAYSLTPPMPDLFLVFSYFLPGMRRWNLSAASCASGTGAVTSRGSVSQEECRQSRRDDCSVSCHWIVRVRSATVFFSGNTKPSITALCRCHVRPFVVAPAVTSQSSNSEAPAGQPGRWRSQGVEARDREGAVASTLPTKIIPQPITEKEAEAAKQRVRNGTNAAKIRLLVRPPRCSIFPWG